MPSVFAQLEGNLDEWVKQSQEKVYAATHAGVVTIADQIVKKAQELCPVSEDTKHGEAPGTLRDTIEAVVQPESHYGIVKTDGKKAWYGYLVHFGTHKMPARPFLYQAAENSTADLKTEIQKNLGD